MNEENIIVTPPIQNQWAQIDERPAGQKNERGYQTRTLTKLQENLSPEQGQALVEIGEYPYIVGVRRHARIASYTDTPGGAETSDQYTHRQQKIVDRYEAWAGHMRVLSPVAMSIACRIGQDCEPIESIVTVERISRKTFWRLLDYSLAEYCILARW